MKNTTEKRRSTNKSKKLKFGEKRVNAKVLFRKAISDETSSSHEYSVAWDIMCSRMYDVYN